MSKGSGGDWPQAREWMIRELGPWKTLRTIHTAAVMAGVTGNQFRRSMTLLHKLLNPRPSCLTRGDWVDDMIWDEMKRLEKLR